MNLRNTTLSLVLVGMSVCAQAQFSPNYIPKDTLKSFVIQLDHKEESTPSMLNISEPDDYKLNPSQQKVITITRKRGVPVFLEVRGRGDLNNVIINEKSKADDIYPLIQKTFRGLRIERIDLSKLTSGDYNIRIVSPHTTTNTKLSLVDSEG